MHRYDVNRAREVLDTLRALKGGGYADLVKHYASNQLMSDAMRARPRPSRLDQFMFAEATSLLLDLTKLCDADTNNDVFRTDVQTLLSALRTEP